MAKQTHYSYCFLAKEKLIAIGADRNCMIVKNARAGELLIISRAWRAMVLVCFALRIINFGIRKNSASAQTKSQNGLGFLIGLGGCSCYAI